MARDAGPPPRGAGEQDDTKQPEAKKGGGLPVKLIIRIVVVLVVGIAGVGLATLVLVPRMRAPDGVEVDTSLQKDVKLYALEQILVNIESDIGTDFLVAEMTLACANQDAYELVESNTARIRDALSALLSSRTYEDTRGVVAREQLQRAVKDKLNGMLGSGTITDVWFTTLVIQSM